MRQLFDAFLFSSTFLACCAVAMVYQTLWLFALPLDLPLMAFTFCGTLCSYNFHWYFTPASFGGSYKTAWSVRHKRLHAFLFFVAAAGAAVCGWLLRENWAWLLVTAFITFLYSAPKIPARFALALQQIAVGKTIFLAFAWAHVTALLPLLLHHQPLNDTQVFFVVNRFYLIYAICVLFDYRDRDADREAGIRSLVTALPRRGVLVLFWSVMVAFAFSAVALALMQFPLPVVGALTVPGVLLMCLLRHALRRRSDYLYYFVLDGLMACSVPLVCFFGAKP